MFLACTRKELLHCVLSARYATVLGLLLLTSLVVTAVRSHVYSRLAADYRAAQVQRNALLQNAVSFERGMPYASWLEKQPQRLWVFAGGLDHEMTRAYSLEHMSMTGLGMRTLPYPSLRYFLDLDMVQIVGFLCSLLALIMVFDAVSGEREQGTLRVLLAGPLPRDTIILGKMAAGAIVVCVPLLMAWLLSLLYAIGPGGMRLQGEEFIRLGLVVGASLLYILFFFSLGMAASCWLRRSATVLAVCLLCWAGFALVIPNIVPVAANLTVPLPSHAKIVREKNSIWPAIELDLLPRYKAATLAGKAMSQREMGDSIVMFWQNTSRDWFERIDRSCSNIILQQTALACRLFRLSPSAAYVNAATHLAGTGALDFVHFLSEHDRAMRAFSSFQKTMYVESREPPRYDPALWPRFRPTAISLTETLLQAGVDLVFLCGGCVVMLLLAFIGFVRSDAAS